LPTETAPRTGAIWSRKRSVHVTQCATWFLIAVFPYTPACDLHAAQIKRSRKVRPRSCLPLA